MQVNTNATAHSVRIVPLDMGHAKDMQRLVSDPLVLRFTPKPEPYPNDEAAREIERAIEDRAHGRAFCFAVLVDGDFAGVCKLKEVTADGGELGYWVGVPFWGRGVATAAAREVLAFAFEELGLETVVAHTLSGNHASGRVLEKLGFELASSERNSHPKWPLEMMVHRYRIEGTSWYRVISFKNG